MKTSKVERGLLGISVACLLFIPTFAQEDTNKAAKRIRVSSIPQSRKLINKVEPKYPADAIQMGIEGTVKLEATIAQDGNIQDLRVIEGGSLLAEAAIEAVSQWRYEPTLIDGRPVEVVTLIELRFRLPSVSSFLLSRKQLKQAGEPWKDKPYTEWTMQDIAKITQDSPWARSRWLRQTTTIMRAETAERRGGILTVPPPTWVERNEGAYVLPTAPEYNPPGDGLSLGPESWEGVIQWASSLTMRQAMVREGEIKGIMTKERRDQLLSIGSEQYLIAVRGPVVHFVLRGFDEPTEESLRNSIYLKPKGSKRKIHPVEMLFSPRGGRVAWFYFPRELEGKPVIRPYEQKVEFHWGASRTKQDKTTFDLRKMLRDGKPDL